MSAGQLLRLPNLGSLTLAIQWDETGRQVMDILSVSLAWVSRQDTLSRVGQSTCLPQPGPSVAR